MSRTAPTHRLDSVRDLYILALILVVSILSRFPFLSTFELVAYDGTYYLNQARTLLSGHMAGTFPIGYPVVVRLFALVTRDYQVAGQLVSFLAGVGAAFLVYLILKRFVNGGLALLGSLVLALNPLFIRLSLSTLSESLYMFLVLAGILMFLRRRYVAFGLLMGAATATRPEAIAIVGLLGLTLVRRPSRALTVAAGFLAIYAVNAVVLSINFGRPVILPKSEYFGTSADLWQFREHQIDFEGREEAESSFFKDIPDESVASEYIKRLPREAWLLCRHALPVVLLFGLLALRWSAFRFLAAGLVSFFVYPLVTVRVDARYVLPYVPFLVLGATLFVGVLSARWRAFGVALLILTIVAAPIVNRDALTVPDEPQLSGTKRVATAFRDRVSAGDRIADRKPFFAYYAGGTYVQIPVAPYDDTMRSLSEMDVRYLVMQRNITHNLRPALRPLLYSSSVINGELRFRQVLFDAAASITVFERNLEADPMIWEPVAPLGTMDEAPAWSPDGQRLAFRSVSASGGGSIYIMDSDGGAPPRKLLDTTAIGDQLSWSPDGAVVTYAGDAGGIHALFAADVDGGRITRLTEGPGNDVSPAWLTDGAGIVFSSDRGGGSDIWVLDVGDDSVTRITEGANATYPAVDPTGKLLAWTVEGRGITLYQIESGHTRTLAFPRQVAYAPSFSPDGRYLVVTASDWGSWDLYMCRTDGTNVLLLTKNFKRESMPSWSPDGERIALVSEHENGLHLWTISALDAYLTRLDDLTRPQVFVAPQ